MFLTGTFHRSLDEKLRFALPKPLRDAVGHPEFSILYLGPGTDGSLALYPEQSFARMAYRLEEVSPNGKDVRAFSRLFFAQVQRVELDKHGRVRLPAELATAAGLEKEVVLLGVRDHMEVWDQSRWTRYLVSTQPHYDELAENALQGANTPVHDAKRTMPGSNTMCDTDVRPIQPR